MGYQLLATDMDGTLLDSKKEIPAENREAINRALEMGKHIVMSTGRCMAELKEFFPLFPRMRYVLGESGACIYDLAEQKVIRQLELEPSVTEQVIRYVRQKDIMVQALVHGEAVMNASDIARLGHFYMSHYENHFRKTGTFVEDVCDYCRQAGWQVEKLCLYHPSQQAREQTLAFVRDMPVTPAFSEQTSLELTPVGADKGAGLEILCAYLDIPLAQTIAVGDGFNDMTILRKAGLAVAVGNAEEAVKAVCDAVVADNDSCGVKQAIVDYLLE
ncbi:MAG: HAD family hydrolase [Eubacteriales bacterium]|nr:HAD family hydrolase [Eubacteriales bacterium]